MRNAQKPSGMPVHKYIPFQDQIKVEQRSAPRVEQRSEPRVERSEPRVERQHSDRGNSNSNQGSSRRGKGRKQFLKLRFGLNDGNKRTLEEIGQLFGVSRERVRQIKEKALSRLRHVSRARALESFLA